jgi:hypothetical protein
MLNADCAYCGAANQPAAQVCVACGDDLIPQSSFPAHDQTAQWQPLFDPNQTLPGIAPFGLDTAISETFSFFGSNFWLITKIVVVTVAPFEIFRALNLAELTDPLESTVWSAVLSGVCKVLIVPALIYALMKIILTGKQPGVHESYRWGLTRLGNLTICAIIMAVLQGLGYALLIIPGIIISLVFILVYPIAVLEKGSVVEVFERSLELTREHLLQIFGAWIVMGILLLITSALGAFIVEASEFWLLRATVAIAGDVMDQIATVMSLFLYLSLPRTSASAGPTGLSLTK